MNYQKIYDSLISSRKERMPTLSEYYERHHIIPKSLGGTDDAGNLILLTAREHFIAHWLLYRIHKNQEMAFAFFIMSSGMKSNNSQRIKFSSIAYSEAKKAKSEYLKILNSKYKKGHVKSEETKKKLSESLKGKRFTSEHSKNIGLSLKGKAKSKQTCEKISRSLISFDWSTYIERNEKISKANSGKQNGRAKRILQKTIDGNIISAYDTMDDARDELSKIIGISMAKSTFHRIVNANKLFGGYFWQYEV